MEKSRAIELLKLAVPIKALTQQEYSDFVEAVNMGMDALEQPTSPDTIDRQAVIKILECWQKAFKENSHHASASDLSLVVKDIRALSATHVATDTNVGDTISRQAAIEVADAVWSVTGDKNVAKVWDQLKDLPPTEPEQRWIPVTERLPKPNEEDELGFIKAYLVQDGRWMDVARWDGGFWVAWGYGIKLNNVTAWMPLPDPWKGEVDEQIR